MFNYFDSTGDVRIAKVVTHVILVLLFVFVVVPAILSSFGTVPAGNRGVHLRFGAVTGEVKGEGLYFKAPFVDDVIIMNVQTQKEDVTASAASKDLQTVSANIAPNFHLDASKVAEVYQLVGVNYQSVIVAPALQESVKAVTAKYTAEELITKREEIRDAIAMLLKEKVTERGIIIDSFNITNFDFSKAFNEAVETKVTAEQNALAAKNKLDQVKYEAQQAVEAAKGKAEALEIEGRAITQNPQVLQGRAIEKWNGVLPQYTGGAMPFINIK